MSEPAPIHAEKSFCRRRRSVAWLAVVAVLAALVGWLVFRMTRPPGEPEAAAPETAGERSAANDRDRSLRRMIIGTWEDDYRGHRTMTLGDDGTGVMIVELSGLTASLFASRLRFDMEWSVEAGRLKKRTVGGEPARQVQMILKTMGDRVAESVLELTPDRLLLLDQDGKTKYDWRRVVKQP